MFNHTTYIPRDLQQRRVDLAWINSQYLKHCLNNETFGLQNFNPSSISQKKNVFAIHLAQDFTL